MEIPESTYYYKPKGNLEKNKRDANIADTIEEIATEFTSYGYRRIPAALRRKGMVVNHKKVLNMMKNIGIQCRKRRRFAITTDSRHNLKVSLTWPEISSWAVQTSSGALILHTSGSLPALYTWQL